jgi:hypothetical protein
MQCDAMRCHVRATRIGPHQTKKVLLAEAEWWKASGRGGVVGTEGSRCLVRVHACALCLHGRDGTPVR